MKNSIKGIFCCIILFCIVSACKTIKITDQERKSMPESFAGKKDSINSAQVNWKEFFKDQKLTSLIDTALKNNYDLLSTLQQIEIARANARLREGQLFPDIALSGAAGQRKFGLYTMDGAGNSSTEITPGQIVPTHLPDYYVGLQTSWEIDIWGKLRNKRKAALADFLGSVEGRRLAVTSLIAEVANTYFELLALDNELSIINETVQLQESALKLITVQRQTGIVNEVALNQFESQLLNTKGLKVDVELRIVDAEGKMNSLLGKYPQTIARDSSQFLTKEFPALHEGIPSDLLLNRPDLKQAELQLIASKADVKAARAAFLPSINISGGVGFQAFNPSYLFMTPQSLAYSLIGGLTAPLINRSALKAEFRTAKASQLNAMYDYQKTILTGYTEVYNELIKMEKLKELVELKSKEVGVLKRAIKSSSALFQTGRTTYLDVLLVQQNALQSKLDLVNAKRLQYTSTVNLYKALGGGWR